MNKIDYIMMWMVWSLILVAITLVWVVSYDWIFWVSCKAKYENAEYWFFKGCMIEYNWKYIPKELYIKAFEQNLNLQVK